ncbi:MAG: family 20 glycosylhydrolase [Clostridia bacterium]|nr:family 20 glycosylhydrolase [Clostridia bacterium]
MRRLSDYLIPLPQKIVESEGTFAVAPFAGAVRISLSEKTDILKEAKRTLEGRLADIAAVTTDGKRGDYLIKIIVDASASDFAYLDNDEAYYVKTGAKESVLCGKTAAGAFYAALTFADMLAAEGDNVLVPDAYVLDYPDFKYRGHTIESRYGTEFLTPKQYYDMIDYFAAQKLNKLIVTLYDCWNYQYDNDPVEFLYMEIPGYPELKTPKKIKYYSAKEKRWVHEENVLPSLFVKDFFGDVIAYAKRKNIVVVPQFNILGHNSLIPRMMPDLSARNQNGTSKERGFCTSNPATYEFVYKIIDKIIDKYVLPFGHDEIHLGLDEVQMPYKCECPKCRDISCLDSFVEYAVNMIKYCKSRGMKHVYICHDVLLTYDVDFGELKKRFIDEKIDDVTVLDWWTYEDPTAGLFYGKADKVDPIVRSRIKPYSGYQNWMATQDTTENIRGCVKLAVEHGFEGVNAYTTYDPAFDKNFLTIADVAWNSAEIDNSEGFDRRYVAKYYPDNEEAALTAFRALYEMTHDDVHEYWQNRLNRWLDYYMFSYRIKEYDEEGKLHLKLKNFPGDCFNRLINSDRVDVAYLEMLKKNSKVIINFFENSGRYDLINDTWLLNARYYERAADEYLTVLGLYREYNDGAVGADRVISELTRLVLERERLMTFAEDVKLEQNRPTYLRDMSVIRQWLVDLRDYFLREVAAGRKPKLDVTNLDYAMSERFAFLR